MRFTLLVLFVTVSILFSLVNKSSAQIADYNTMVGVVGGTNIGGTVKQFISYNGAVDLLVYRRWKGWVAAALYEHHMDIREFRGLEWYFGEGLITEFGKMERGSRLGFIRLTRIIMFME